MRPLEGGIWTSKEAEDLLQESRTPWISSWLSKSQVRFGDAYLGQSVCMPTDAQPIVLVPLCLLSCAQLVFLRVTFLDLEVLPFLNPYLTRPLFKASTPKASSKHMYDLGNMDRLPWWHVVL